MAAKGNSVPIDGNSIAAPTSVDDGPDTRTPDQIATDKEVNRALLVFIQKTQSILALTQVVVTQEQACINAQIAYGARYTKLADSGKRWYYGTTAEGKKGKSRSFQEVDNELRRLSTANDQARQLLDQRKAELQAAKLARDEGLQHWTTGSTGVELPKEILALIKEFSGIV